MPIVIKKSQKNKVSFDLNKSYTVREAIKILKVLDSAYYNTNIQHVDNAEYDVFRQKIEKKYNKEKKINGEDAIAEKYFASVRAPVLKEVRASKRDSKLPIPLGSLKKIHNDEDSKLELFYKNAKKASLEIAKNLRNTKTSAKAGSRLSVYENGVCFIQSPKLDGLTFLLHYHKGTLVEAYTGGNGIMGMKKLQHALKLVAANKIPMKISASKFAKFKYNDIYVNGELACLKKAFNKLVESQKKRKDKVIYNDPRNAASGWLSAEEPNPELDSAITYIAYDIFTEFGDLGVDKDLESICDEAHAISSKATTLGVLKSSGFKTYWNSGFFHSTIINGGIDGIKKQLAYDLEKIKDSPIQLDGLVLEVSDSLIRKEMGTKDGTPYYAVAYKRSAKSALAEGKGKRTTIKKIEANTSKVGAIKPTLIFDTVRLGNANVSRATGNNFQLLIKQGIGVGTIVDVVKAGDIIPKAYFADKKKADISKIVPKTCSCGAKAIPVILDIVKKTYMPDYYCSKPESCEFVQFELLKSALKSTKLIGLGEKNIRKIYDAGFTNIFLLLEGVQSKSKFAKLSSIDGFGESLLNTLKQGLPESINKMDVPQLMEMSGIFIRPGLALAKSSFEDIFHATKGKLDNSTHKEKIKEYLGPARAELFISKYPTWKKFYSKIKTGSK